MHVAEIPNFYVFEFVFLNLFVFVFVAAFLLSQEPGDCSEVDLSKLGVLSKRGICIFGAWFYEELWSIHARYVAPRVFYGASLDPADAVLHP